MTSGLARNLIKSARRLTTNQDASIIQTNQDEEARLSNIFRSKQASPRRLVSHNMHSSYNPGLHDAVRKQNARKINFDNQMLAMKLITVKGHEVLTKRNLDKSYEHQVKVKSLLCKLPIIDMKNNTFKFGGAE